MYPGKRLIPLIVDLFFFQDRLWSNSVFVRLSSGGPSADSSAAAAESAAGRADPEEALPHGHPEEKQQTTHPAAFEHPFIYTNPSHDQFKPNLHLQICSFCCSNSQHSPCFYYWHPTQLEGKAEEGQDQSSGGPGCSGAGFRLGQG